MKKKLGYFYKLSSESISKALEYYMWSGSSDPLQFFGKTVKEIERSIAEDKSNNIIPKTAKPKIFKITVEEVESK